MPKPIRHRETNLRTEVNRADKDRQKDKTWEAEYTLPDGRTLKAKTDERGPYADD